MPTLIPNYLIGRNVLWYPNADKALTPRPAIVTGPAELREDRLLNLTIFPENSPTSLCREYVRHIDDPILEERPRMKERGGWDFLMPTPQKHSVPAKEPPKKETPKS